MKSVQLIVLVGFCLFLNAFGTRAFAATRTPVKITLDPALLEKLTPEQRQDIEEIRKLFERRLYTWTDLPIELSPSVFNSENGQIIEINHLFIQPHTNELLKIGKERLELSAEQLTQIKQEALFTVPSRDYPGQNHVWKLSFILQEGSKNIELKFQSAKKDAVAHLVVKLPARIWGTTPLSIRRGLVNFYTGIREVLGLVIGLPSNERLFNDSEVEQLIAERRAAHHYTSNVVSGYDRNTTVDMRLFNDELMEKALSIVSRIEAAVTERAVTVEGAEFDVHQRKWGKIVEARQEEFYKAILESDELEKLSSGLGKLLVEHGKAIQIVSEQEGLYANFIKRHAEAFRAKLEQSLRGKHDAAYVNEKVEKYVAKIHGEQRWKFYWQVADTLNRKGLHKEATLLGRDLDFYQRAEPKLRALYQEQLKPARSFEFKRQVWRKSRWEVVKNPVTDRFEINKHKSYVVDTGTTFWRIRKLYQQSINVANNALYWLLVENLYEGPLGVKALVGAQPFSGMWIVDPATGEVVRGKALTPTMQSRIEASFATRKRLLEEHENRDSYGFFGKSIERALLFFSADLFRGGVVPASIAIGQPVLTAANTAASSAVSLTSVAWAPLSSMLSLGWNAMVHDSDGVHERRISRYLPLLSSLLVKAGAQGGGETIASVAALFYHPAMAFGHYVYGATRAKIRTAYDALMYRAIAKYGRVPGRNTTLMVRRTSGPGLSSEYFYQLPPDLALVSLWADLEYGVLEREVGRFTEQIVEPRKNYERVLQVLEIATGSRSTSDGVMGKAPIEQGIRENLTRLKDKTAPRIAQYQRLLFNPAKGRVKLSTEEWTKVMEKAVVLTKSFYTKLAAEENWTETQQAEVFTKQGLAPNDWQGLVRTRMAAIFGTEVLTPLEAADKTLVLEVKDPGLSDYVRALEKGVMPEPLDPVQPTEPSTPVSSVKKVVRLEAGAQRVCQNMLLGLLEPRLAIRRSGR